MPETLHDSLAVCAATILAWLFLRVRRDRRETSVNVTPVPPQRVRRNVQKKVQAKE
jgi:hypothetical protein